MNRLGLLIAVDAIMAVLALIGALLIRFGSVPETYDLHSLLGMAKAGLLIVILLFVSFVLELYNYEKTVKKREVLVKVCIGLILAFFILSSIYYMVPELMLGRGLLLLALLIFGSGQLLSHILVQFGSNHPGLANRVLILGTGPVAHQIGGIVRSTNHNHVLTGYLNCTNEPVYVPSQDIIGSEGGIATTALREKIHKLVISLSERRGTFPLNEVLSCKFSGIEVLDAPAFYEQLTGKLMIENITPGWFIFSAGFRITAILRIFKRVADFVLSAIGLVLTLPLLPLISLAVKLSSPGPVLFSQVRVGEREKTFVLYKFRTMREDAESDSGAVWAQVDDPRVTGVGRFLRKSRLDEIPQLYNVLRGDMSVVGPRPERPEFVCKLKDIIPYYSERHFVKPGITGWAQVKYAYGASVEDAIEKLRYDLYYIKNLSLFLDLLIIFETVKVVLFGRGR